MEKERFIKFVTDWVWYERTLRELEFFGISPSSDSPIWRISDNYGALLCEQYNLTLEWIDKYLTPVFIRSDITDVEEYLEGLIEVTHIL